MALVELHLTLQYYIKLIMLHSSLRERQTSASPLNQTWNQLAEWLNWREIVLWLRQGLHQHAPDLGGVLGSHCDKSGAAEERSRGNGPLN